MNEKRNRNMMKAVNQIDQLSSKNTLNQFVNYIGIDLRQLSIEDILNDQRFNQKIGANTN